MTWFIKRNANKKDIFVYQIPLEMTFDILQSWTVDYTSRRNQGCFTLKNLPAKRTSPSSTSHDRRWKVSEEQMAKYSNLKVRLLIACKRSFLSIISSHLNDDAKYSRVYYTNYSGKSTHTAYITSVCHSCASFSHECS